MFRYVYYTPTINHPSTMIIFNTPCKHQISLSCKLYQILDSSPHPFLCLKIMHVGSVGPFWTDASLLVLLLMLTPLTSNEYFRSYLQSQCTRERCSVPAEMVGQEQLDGYNGVETRLAIFKFFFHIWAHTW